MVSRIERNSLVTCRTLRIVAVVCMVAPSLLFAQAGMPPSRVAMDPAAAEAITAEGIGRHIEALTRDSMIKNTTPSQRMEATARYVAEQLSQLGVRPRGELAWRQPDSSWFQRYPFPGQKRLDYRASTLTLVTKLASHGKPVLDINGWPVEKKVVLDFAGAARFAVDTVPQSGASSGTEQAVVVGGRQTIESVRNARLRDKIVVYVPEPSADSALRRQLLNELFASNHVLVVSDEDSLVFRSRQDHAFGKPVVIDKYLEQTLGMRHWGVAVHPAIEGFWEAAGIALSELRASNSPVLHPLPLLNGWLEPKLDTTKTSDSAGVNVIGVLPGGDSSRSHQLVVFLAHVDHDGSRSGLAGANDNVSGVAALLEIAKAFTASGKAPRRSVVFAVVNESRRGLWSSTYFVEHLSDNPYSSVPAWLDRVVININLDMMGRGAKDSVMVRGIDDLELPRRPDWIAAAHGGLGLTVVNAGTVVVPESDQLPFVRRAVPSLSFSDGERDTEALAGDSRFTSNPSQVARIAQLAYYVGAEIANADRRPAWTTEGRRARMQVFGP